MTGRIEHLQAASAVRHDDLQPAVAIKIGEHRQTKLAGLHGALELPLTLALFIETIDRTRSIDRNDRKAAFAAQIGCNGRCFNRQIKLHTEPLFGLWTYQHDLAGVQANENASRFFDRTKMGWVADGLGA